jgi:uncharacterized membrane-anchored protein YhcB (DUF1043 family)
MTDDERIKKLERNYQKLSDNFDTFIYSINRILTNALIAFLLGLIVGFLL